MRHSYVLLAFVLVAGCARTRLAPQATRVRLTLNHDEVRGCRLIGSVEASRRRYLWFPGKGASQESVSRQLRNDAARLGANVVVLTSSTTGMTRSESRGQAYVCA